MAELKDGRAGLIGGTVSHYRILDLLGKGGMGEVYRAEDLDLRREVALKVIPENLSTDPERLDRFKREARSLAALNHPNIVTVFSIERDQELDFLTMELIEGQTLELLIPARGLGIDRFFELAIPLVDAISTAHAEGIVHRDIKPSNVMVTRDGRLKVLDFGLVKLSHENESDIESSLSTEGLTSENQIIGTLAYMSPEQIQGREVDARSDIFSLGVLLYQMATGKKPFSGSSSMELVSSVLRDNPPSAVDLRPTLPPHLSRILGRCLEKDRKERHQSARDLRFELEELREELQTGEAVRSSIEVTRPPAQRGKWWIPAVVVVVVALIGLLIWQPWTSRDGPIQDAQTTAPAITWPSEEQDGRISPDGQWLTFRSDRGGSMHLWIRRLDGGEPRALTSGDRTILGHAWSPAGDEIALLARQGDSKRLEIIPAPLGGNPRLSLPVRDPEGVVDWVGNTIYLDSHSTLWSLDPDSGELAKVSLPTAEFAFLRHFDVSADGKSVLFSALRDGREDIWRLDTDSGELRALTDDGAKATWPHCMDRACIRVAYLSNRTGQTDIWISEQDSSHQMKIPTQVEILYDVSTDEASMALKVLLENADLWLWDRATLKHEPLTVDSLTDFGASVAADSSILAFQRTLPATEVQSRLLDSQIMLSRLDGGRLAEPRRLADGYAPLLSPDGRRVAFLRMAPGAYLYTELWAGDVESGRTVLISDRFQVPGFWEWPADLIARNFVWTADNELLWVEAEPDGVRRIQQSSFAGDSPLTEIYWAPTARLRRINDLSLSADESVLSFAVRIEDSDLWELRKVRQGEAPQTLYSKLLPRGSLRVMGLSADGTRTFLLEILPNPAGAETVELLEVRDTGEPRSIATLKRAFSNTARFRQEDGVIFLSAAEDDIYNIIAVDLETGSQTRITDNRLPGIAFCGLSPQANGNLVYSRHQRNADLWLLRRGGPTAAGG